MKMIVGLGNPGAKYEATRHNIGFILLDAIEEHYGRNWRSKFNAEEEKTTIATRDVILLKPQTFMNLSGQSVAAAAKFYKIKPRDILVIHDELDLEPGRVKLKQGGGHAGHNGLRSIIEHIGADFERLRVGIGHPGDKSKVSGYVLHDFAKADQDWIARLQDNLPKALPYWLEGNPSKFIEALGGKNLSQKNFGHKNFGHKNFGGAAKPQEAKSKSPKPPKSQPAQDEKPANSSPFDALKNLIKRED